MLACRRIGILVRRRIGMLACRRNLTECLAKSLARVRVIPAKDLSKVEANLLLSRAAMLSRGRKHGVTMKRQRTELVFTSCCACYRQVSAVG